MCLTSKMRFTIKYSDLTTKGSKTKIQTKPNQLKNQKSKFHRNLKIKLSNPHTVIKV